MRPQIDLKVKLLEPDASVPFYVYEGDAGLDLSSTIDITLAPGERALIPTGIAIAIPDGFAGFVQPRSGLAAREGLGIVNTPGLIDSHYRGELVVIAINLDPHKNIFIAKGMRIAQLVIQEIPLVHISLVDDLDDTDRGSNGFGSSGV